MINKQEIYTSITPTHWQDPANLTYSAVHDLVLSHEQKLDQRDVIALQAPGDLEYKMRTKAVDYIHNLLYYDISQRIALLAFLAGPGDMQDQLTQLYQEITK